MVTSCQNDKAWSLMMIKSIQSQIEWLHNTRFHIMSTVDQYLNIILFSLVESIARVFTLCPRHMGTSWNSDWDQFTQ